MSSSLRHPLTVAAGLVLVAFVLRSIGSDAGLPYCWHPDEPKLINLGVEMLRTGDWNPGWFHYPTLPIYIHAVGAALSYLSSVGEGAFVHLDAIPTGVDTGLIHTVGDADMWLRARRITAAMGALAAGLTCLAAHRFFDDARIALLAGAIVALSPQHIVHSRLITVDVPTSMGLAALLLACAWLLREGRPRHFLQAAICLGVTIGFKYNAAVAAVVPLLAWALSERRGERLWLGLGLVPLAGVVFVLTMPYALADTTTALTDMAREVNHYMVRGHGEATTETGWVHVGRMLETLSVDYLPGWLLLAAGVVLGRGRWRALVILAAFPIAYVAYMSGAAVFFRRNAVVLVPALATLSAAGGVWALDRLRVRMPRVPRLTWLGLLIPGALALAETAGAPGREDSRSELMRDLREAPIGRVAVPRELRIHPTDLDGVDWVDVGLGDGPAAWRDAGAVAVLGSDRLRFGGTRENALDPTSVEEASAWFEAREPSMRRGHGAWTLDLYARSPSVAVYPLEARPTLTLERTSEPSRACTPQESALGVLGVEGRWTTLEHSADAPPSKVTARFFDDAGKSSGVVVLARARDAAAAPLDQPLDAPEGAVRVRLCLEAPEGPGSVSASDLRVVTAARL